MTKQTKSETDGGTDGQIDQWTDDAVNDAFPLRTKMYFIFERAQENKCWREREREKKSDRLSCNSKLICIANWRAIKQLQFMCITISERVSAFPPLSGFCFPFSSAKVSDVSAKEGGLCQVYKSELKLIISIILIMCKRNEVISYETSDIYKFYEWIYRK